MLAHGALRRHRHLLLLLLDLLLLDLLLWWSWWGASSRPRSGSSGSSAGSGRRDPMGRVVRRLMGEIRVLVGPLEHSRSVSESRIRRKLIESGSSGGRNPGLGHKLQRLGRLGLAADGQKTHTVVVGRHCSVL
jgi:hypothetical protein